MHVSNLHATSFITPFGSFCYVSTPFGLKNTDGTFQRCMQECFESQIGHNLEAYIDDVVVKS